MFEIKYLHLAIIAPIPRKLLPEIGKVVAIKSAHSWHHFIAKSPWQVTELKEKRLTKFIKELNGKTITLVIDETKSIKKWKKTYYVARQYLGSVAKIDKGIVSVNAYGIYENIIFPLTFQVFKPKGTLKPSDNYKTKIDRAGEIITELIDQGFQSEGVLADSLYSKSSQILKILDKYKLPYIVSIRSNHGVGLPCHQRVRANKCCQFQRVLSDGKSENRYIREIIYGKKGAVTYWEITTDPEMMPSNSTSFVKTNLKGKLIKKLVGNLYVLRTWVEYGFRQCKQELGQTDYRFTILILKSGGQLFFVF